MFAYLWRSRTRGSRKNLSHYRGGHTLKLAIMQPYVFPYIGYFNLISKVDKFVFLDDVNFIKKGWINKNRLIFSGKECHFTIPMNSVSQNDLISDVLILKDSRWKKNFQKSIWQSYKHAPFFEQTYFFIEATILSDYISISTLAKQSILMVSNYLDIPTKFINSSIDYNNSHLKGQERILDICVREEAESYWNLPGGKDLYVEKDFNSKNIELNFINQDLKCYPQYTKDFIPGLSIIDVMMHNSPQDIREMML